MVTFHIIYFYSKVFTYSSVSILAILGLHSFTKWQQLLRCEICLTDATKHSVILSECKICCATVMLIGIM